MNEKRHAQMEPDNEVDNEQHEAMYAKAGYPFPMGPVIPRPNPRLKPLWPGLEIKGLNRPKAAAQVMLNVYSVQDPQGNGDHAVWRGTKGPLAGKMDLAFRNHIKRSGVLDDVSEPSSEWPLKVLDLWLNSLDRPSALLREMFTAKMRPDIINLYSGRSNNARKRPTLFAPPEYPVGDVSTEVNHVSEVDGTPSAANWVRRYGQETKVYIRDLLNEPAGEWNVLTLLFVKLLNAHMAWLVPKYVHADAKNLFYRPLIRQLRQCAMRVGESEAHPLAGTAAGILQTLPRLNLLLSSGKKTDKDFPEHPKPLDPKNEWLPDSLHLDSPISIASCIVEVKAVFQWMDKDKTAGGNEWESLSSWADDVAILAWEFASARTDPFSLGGFGLVNFSKNILTGEIIFYTKDLDFEKYKNSWDETCKPIKSILRKGVENYSQSKTNRIPLRLIKLIAEKDRPEELERFILRNRELAQYYQLFKTLLTDYELNKFQSADDRVQL